MTRIYNLSSEEKNVIEKNPRGLFSDDADTSARAPRHRSTRNVQIRKGTKKPRPKSGLRG